MAEQKDASTEEARSRAKSGQRTRHTLAGAAENGRPLNAGSAKCGRRLPALDVINFRMLLKTKKAPWRRWNKKKSKVQIELSAVRLGLANKRLVSFVTRLIRDRSGGPKPRNAPNFGRFSISLKALCTSFDQRPPAHLGPNDAIYLQRAAHCI